MEIYEKNLMEFHETSWNFIKMFTTFHETMEFYENFHEITSWNFMKIGFDSLGESKLKIVPGDVGL
jgi:hypothetical protein